MAPTRPEKRLATSAGIQAMLQSTLCWRTSPWWRGMPTVRLRLTCAPLSAIANITGCTAVGLLAGAVVAAPLIGAAIGALVGSVGTAIGAAAERIDSEFIREVEQMMKPGTSALFMLDHQGDLEVILHTIRGLGGTVLKTNVSPELTQLIQSTLATKPTTTTSKPVEGAGGAEKI